MKLLASIKCSFCGSTESWHVKTECLFWIKYAQHLIAVPQLHYIMVCNWCPILSTKMHLPSECRCVCPADWSSEKLEGKTAAFCDKTVEHLSSEQLIYSINKNHSLQVWDSKVKSFLNISTYWKAIPYILATFGSDKPYMGWLSNQLSQECSVLPSGSIYRIPIWHFLKKYLLFINSYVISGQMSPEGIM